MNTRATRSAALVLAVLTIGSVARGEDQKKSNPKELAKLVAEGDKLLAAGKPLDARNYYLTVVKEDPTNAAVALKLARISEDARDWGGAIAAYQIVVANGGAADQASGYVGLTSAYVRSAQYREASESARKAIALNPSIPSVYVDLAYSLMRIGAAPEALAAARKAVEVSPASVLAHVTLGEALLAQGKVADAEGPFRKALELDPKSGEAYAGLADVQYRQKDFKAAIGSASRALDLNSSLTRMYALRGKADANLGDYGAAYSDLLMALTVNPDDADSHLAFAEAQRARSPEMAAESYRKALSLNPDLIQASLELGELLLGKGDYSGARAVAEQAIQRSPEAALAHALLGTICEKQKQVEPALQAFGRALELDGNLADVHDARGKLLHEQKKDIPGAVTSFEKAVALAPDNLDFQTDLGAALYDGKQADRAIQILQKAAAGSGYKNPRGFAVLGLALKDRQSFGEALAWFDKAAALAPKWWLPHWGAAWSQFGLIKKGCPCGPDDAERVRKMKEHVDAMVSLEGKDPALEQRVAGLVKGDKIR